MSHLRNLIRRVNEKLGVKAPFIASIIEYTKHFDGWTREEWLDARDIVRRFGLDIKDPVEVLLARHFGPKDRWKIACVRCGKIINGGKTPMRGMGRDCYGIVGNGPMDTTDLNWLRVGKKEPKELDASDFLRWKDNRDNDRT